MRINREDLNKGLLEYIEASATSFHAVAAAVALLEKEGFQRLEEKASWQVGRALVPGGKYYVTRNNSSIIAFKVPQKGLAPFKITAAHNDSPCLKIKENSELASGEKYTKLNVEVYGGAIYYSWFDRPLSIAGRVILNTENGIKEKLVDFKKDMVIVPSVAIHLNREINKGFAINPQVDLLPLFAMKTPETSLEEGATVKKLIAEELGVNPEDILGHDLFVYNNAKGSIWGADKEFLSAPRLDDLACGYACLYSFISTENEDAVSVFALFDNEEEGSLTKQGADSTFLGDVLSRICMGMGASQEDYYCMLARSFMISADNAHGVHPNHPEKYDENNRCFLNGGPVIKFNAGQKYTTDAVSAAYFKKICGMADVPFQVFANRSDMAGGSTLGRLSAGHVSVNMVDIGLPQLAMHSSYETMGTFDMEYLVKALCSFYGKNIIIE